MTGDPITSVFNDGYIAEQFEAWRRDPASVDSSWRQYFATAERLTGGSGGAASGAPADSAEYARKVAGAANLADNIRTYGHLAVPLDPLGTPRTGAQELSAAFHGITQADLAMIPGSALGFPHMATAADVIERLRLRYETNLAIEVMHVSEEEERAWFRATLTAQKLTRKLTPGEKSRVLRRLTEVDGLERFLARAYVGYKRFSIEGTDALVPMLETAIEAAAHAGARDVGIAMAHRGRINVLAHILGKPVGKIFAEFDGRRGTGDGDSSTGDVKYHLGYRGKRLVEGVGELNVWLEPNPSHLEIVNPVLSGATRARQRTVNGGRDEALVLPICVHGDAAIAGEGIVPESFNLSALNGYRIGGTLHIIVNNQVGFTTDPMDARSTHYASDIAKGFEVPIIHVNADDAEACVMAVRIAIAYRARFHKDFLIDLVGYRRWGHNEGDEPTYTQPAMYAKVKAQPTAREVWAARLIGEGIATAADVAAVETAVMAGFEAEHAAMKATPAPASHKSPTVSPPAAVPGDTGVSADRLTSINEQLLQYPVEFHAHPRLVKQLERRREAVGPAGGIDWGHAEALAFGSLLMEGTSVRLTGQDCERGTFSHRHAVLNDVQDGKKYMPLAHLAGAKGTIEIHNSPLSETAVMGFEYGYSVSSPQTLSLWEAQFGDFVNVAQPMIDQFLSADRAKWGQDSGLVLLLPHGYEGQGPEHSSARLERFLQLCAEGNLHVAYPTSPAQYFHVLRRQAAMNPRRPLVLMQPKSLLRLPQAASALSDLSTGAFKPVIDDAVAMQLREGVRRLIFCTGKVYYDLTAKPVGDEIAIVRIEELYPWPQDEIAHIVDLYPTIEEIAWVQEEPKNMGAWTYVWPRLRVAAGNAMELRYVGRPERASPAEGYASDHAEEQGRIVADAIAPRPANARRKGMATRA